MAFKNNERIRLLVEGVPSGAKARLTLATPSGGKQREPATRVLVANTCEAEYVANEVGTWTYAWEAVDASGVVIGTASGTFDVEAAAVVTMTASVTAA